MIKEIKVALHFLGSDVVLTIEISDGLAKFAQRINASILGQEGRLRIVMQAEQAAVNSNINKITLLGFEEGNPVINQMTQKDIAILCGKLSWALGISVSDKVLEILNFPCQ